MRKVPGLDNITFKTPGLPWQSGVQPFSPSDLNPLLWWSAKGLDGLTLTGVDVISLDDLGLNSIDASQSTPANRPVVDNATTPNNVTFVSANSEILTNVNDVSLLTDKSIGSITYLPNPIGVSEFGQLALANSSNTQNFILIGTNSANKAEFRIRISNVTNSIISNDVVGSDAVVEVSSNGTSWNLRINGIDAGFTTTLGNTGDWFDAPIGLDSISVGGAMRSSTIYYNTIFRECIVNDNVLTLSESLNQSNYLIEKHGL